MPRRSLDLLDLSEPEEEKKAGMLMQNALFGLSPTVLALLLAALTGGTFIIVMGIGMNNPLIAHMGLRNIVRRPTQAAIMIAGLTLFGYLHHRLVWIAR
jgi:hypothetical protein